MVPEWRSSRIGDLGKVITGRTPPGTAEKYFGGDVLFLTPSDFDERRYIESTARTLSPLGADELKRVIIERGVAVSCIGWQMGKSVLIGQPTATNQQINTVVPDESKVSLLFLYYSLLARRNQIFGLGSTATRTPIVNKSTFENIEILIPDLNEQHSIAAILGSLDEKIELNRRMNATLEQMAQALFKSWFVDFDPVKAKAEGRAPEGMDAETAALFPSEFEESELGPIPKGWRQGKLGELCFNHREGVKPGEVKPDTPYIGLEHMPRKCIALDDWAYAAEAESGKSSFRTGDILFGKLRPYFHKVGVAPIDGVCSTDILVIRPTTQEFFGVALSHLSSVEIINYADKLSNGAKMPRTKWEDLAAYQIAIPSTDVAASLSVTAQAVVDRIQGNIAESRKLAELRDALLPRLISGQLRIPEADAMAVGEL